MAGARVVSAECDFGPREILTGELAEYLVQPDCINGYVEAIERALGSDPSLDDDFIKRYGADEVIQQYFMRYEAAMGSATEVE